MDIRGSVFFSRREDWAFRVRPGLDSGGRMISFVRVERSDKLARQVFKQNSFLPSLSSLRSISISISISVTLSPPPISGLVFQTLIPIQNLHQFKFHHLRSPTLCNFERDLHSRVPPSHHITAGDTFDANLIILSCIHHFSDGFTCSFPVSGVVTELDLPHWSI